MRKIFWILSFLLVISFPGLIQAQIQPECASLQEIFNAPVEGNGNICKVEIAREGLEVTHMGKILSPETMGLAFHFSFEKVDTETVVIGEMALLEDEVNEVVDELRKGNIEVSAIHNHMIHEQPRIMYLHLQGSGDLSKQANTIKNAIEKTGK